jgi:hypothetical protein
MHTSQHTSLARPSVFRAAAAAALFATAGAALVPTVAHAAQPERFAAGRILVSPRAGLPVKEFDKIIFWEKYAG